MRSDSVEKLWREKQAGYIDGLERLPLTPTPLPMGEGLEIAAMNYCDLRLTSSIRNDVATLEPSTPTK